MAASLLQNLQSIQDLAEESSDSDGGEYNPFHFNSMDDQFHSFERIYENHFAVKDKKYLRVPREKMSLLQRAGKKIKHWLTVIRKEHQVFTELKEGYLSLRRKVDQYDVILAQQKANALQDYNKLKEEYDNFKMEHEAMEEQMKSQIESLQEELAEKNKKIAKQERSYKMLIEDEAALYEKKQLLTNEVSKLQKELQNIKDIKTVGYVNLNAGVTQTMSTFELVLSSKVKPSLIPFLDIHDVCQLKLVSKNVYLAIAPPKTFVPFIVNHKLSQVRKESYYLKLQIDEFKNIIKTCSTEALKQQMIKIFQNKINLSDLINPVLKEAQGLIAGKQFIGATQIRTEYNQFQDNLDIFLNQQKVFYQGAAEALKGEFPWKQFFDDMYQIPTVDNRQQTSMRLFMQAQSIQQRLFELSNLCSVDAGIFGMYLSSLQKAFATVYVFAQNLSTETSELQALAYYIMVLCLQSFRREKQSREALEDLQESTQTFDDTKKFLNQRVQDVERTLMQLQKETEQKASIIDDKNRQQKQLEERIESLEQQTVKQGEQLKILATSALNYKQKYNEMAGLYNELLIQLQSITKGVSDLVYKY